MERTRLIVTAGLAAFAGGTLAGFVVLAVERHDPDWAIVGLTFALVGVTSIYVVFTWRLTNETALARREEQQRWHLDRLHQHALAALDVVRRAQDDLAAIDDGRHRAQAAHYASALNEHIPFLEASIRGRVEFCKEVTRVSAFPESQFGNPGIAFIAARQVRERTRWSLEAYLAGRPLPDWIDFNGDPLPEGNNFAWLINVSNTRQG